MKSIIIVLLGIAALISFVLVITQIFSHMGWRRRLVILLNLIVLGYDIFFFVAVCGGIPHASVHFGGGLGDLLFTFTLVLMIIFHIITLAIMIYKTSHAIWFLTPLLPISIILIGMHYEAARGNKSNGYMRGGNCAGLYYNALAHSLHRQEMDEPEFATLFESRLYYAERGDLEAQNTVATCYATGNGVEQNDTLAIKWCRSAAEAGYAMSQRNLGVCYYHGSTGLAVDYVEAAKWLRKAAEQGNDDARYLLGRCYGAGKGVEQSDDEASKWLCLAAQNGHEQAQKLLQENGQAW